MAPSAQSVRIRTRIARGNRSGDRRVLGATAVIGLAVWLVAKAVALPVIGEYFTDMRDSMNEVIEEARFADDFQRVERVLRRIESNTAESLAIQSEAVANEEVVELAD